MARITEGVYFLVQDILATKSEPYSEDITLEVCQAIENNPDWRRRYDELSDELRYWVVNNSIGYYTKEITGLRSGRKAVAHDCDLIGSYTKLTQ